DHDPRVRQIALDAVAAGDDPDARATVLALARSAGDLELRTDALAALGRAHRSEAVPLMLAQLPRADGATQRRLIEILGEAGDRAAVPALAQIVRTGGSAGVRQTALSALGQLGGPDALKALQEVLLGGRRDEIGAAAYALANTSDESAHKLLLGVAQSARPEAAEAALHALAQFEGDDVRALMLAQLSARDGQLSGPAANYFAMHHDDRAVPRLIEIARHGSRAAVAQAVSALSQIGGDAAAAAVRELASRPGPARDSALSTLPSLPGGAEAARKLMIQLVREDGGQAAPSAVWGLGD